MHEKILGSSKCLLDNTNNAIQREACGQPHRRVIFLTLVCLLLEQRQLCSEAVIRQLAGSCQEVIRQLSGSHQAVVKQSSGSQQAVSSQSSFP